MNKDKFISKSKKNYSCVNNKSNHKKKLEKNPKFLILLL